MADDYILRATILLLHILSIHHAEWSGLLKCVHQIIVKIKGLFFFLQKILPITCVHAFRIE